MVTREQFNFVQRMIKLRLWSVQTVMRQPDIRACWGTQWILERLKEKQVVDNLHHAPCCGANHYHKTRLVFHRCTCGANVPDQPRGK